MTTLISLFSGLLGVLIGAGLSWAIARRERRISTSFEMHKEFNGIEMARLRYTASKLLSEHPGQTYLELRGKVGNLAMRDVWTVSHFYQRLWLAIKFRAVHAKLVPELFGDLFSWWYENSFHIQLIPLDTEPAQHIGHLKDWLDRHSTTTQKDLWFRGNRHFPIESADGVRLPPSSINSTGDSLG